MPKDCKKCKIIDKDARPNHSDISHDFTDICLSCREEELRKTEKALAKEKKLSALRLKALKLVCRTRLLGHHSASCSCSYCSVPEAVSLEKEINHWLKEAEANTLKDSLMKT